MFLLSTRSTRLQPIIEESLYPAMEDFKIEIVTAWAQAPAPSRCPIEPLHLWAHHAHRPTDLAAALAFGIVSD